MVRHFSVLHFQVVHFQSPRVRIVPLYSVRPLLVLTEGHMEKNGGLCCVHCIGRLRNDLYCVEWGVKLYSNQPLHQRHIHGAPASYILIKIAPPSDSAIQMQLMIYTLLLITSILAPWAIVSARTCIALQCRDESENISAVYMDYVPRIINPFTSQCRDQYHGVSRKPRLQPGSKL